MTVAALALFAAAVVALTAPHAEAATTLRMATLAPKQSPWGKVFRAWSEAIARDTHGSVELTWLWNGVAGPERSVIGKVRTGQLAGGAVTAAGLSSIYKPIIALQMPGLFETWAELDHARATLRPEFDRELAKRDFSVVGWGDVGRARTFSKGFEVRLPGDIRGHAPAQTIDDVITPKVLAAIGSVRSHPADVNEFLPMLENHSIDVVTAPALAVEQLQWAAYLDHMNTGVVAFAIGATVIGNEALGELSGDERTVVMDTGRRASDILAKRIRIEDDAAFERLEKKMAVHDPTDEERAAWRAVWKQACTRVKESVPGDVLERLGGC